MMPKRKLQIIQKNNHEIVLSLAAMGHIQRSKIIKPQISVIYSEDIIREGEDEKIYEKAKSTSEDQKIKVHVVSDGRRALLKRID